MFWYLFSLAELSLGAWCLGQQKYIWAFCLMTLGFSDLFYQMRKTKEKSNKDILSDDKNKEE